MYGGAHVHYVILTVIRVMLHCGEIRRFHWSCSKCTSLLDCLTATCAYISSMVSLVMKQLPCDLTSMPQH
jgi:hypothetical protein